jgi:dTDP-glucose 4,6-dehydratase
MKILVTGSLGCVGKPLLEELKCRGYEVFGLDRMHHHDMEHAFTIGFAPDGTYFRVDIGEYRQLEKVIQYVKPDLIYNCAAEFGRWNGSDCYETLWRTNVVGLKHLLVLQSKFSFRLAHFSSSEVYGDYQDVMAEDVLDKIPIEQMNDYALTKRVNELQIKNSSHSDRCAIFRLFNLYGPNEHYSVYRSVNCRMIYSALHNLPFTVFCGHHRSSTYIDDAINSIANLTKLSGEDFSQIFNIGSNNYHTIEGMASLVVEHTGCDPSLFTYKGAEPNTTKDKKVDISRAKKFLGLKTTWSLDEGIAETVNWMKKVYGRN